MVNQSKGYANHPFKTRAGAKVFQNFLHHIGCRWNVDNDGTHVVHSQRITCSGNEYVYDLDTMGVYRTEQCDDEVSLADCIGTWKVSKQIRSTWAPDDVIDMDEVEGTWCPLAT